MKTSTTKATEMNDNNGQCGAIFPSGAARCALRFNHLGPCRDWRGVADDRTNLGISNDFLKREVARLETFIADRNFLKHEVTRLETFIAERTSPGCQHKGCTFQETFRPTPAPLGDPDRTRLKFALEDIEALKVNSNVTAEIAAQIEAISCQIDKMLEDPDRTRLHLALEDIEALKMGAKVTTELAGRIDALSRRIDTIHERLGERINDLLRLLRETHR